MVKDVRYAFRILLQAKGWTAVVVMSLGLGIGANAALFSAVNGLLLRKLPVSDPDRLVRLRSVGPNDMTTGSWDYGFTAKTPAGENVKTTFSYPMFQNFRAAAGPIVDLFACAPAGRRATVAVDGVAETAAVFLSSGNYYNVLGVSARLGRTIRPDDDHAAAAPVAVISSAYWHSRFAEDASAVGKVIRVNDVPVTIVGVLPPRFTGVQAVSDSAPDVSLPLSLDPRINTGERDRLTQATYWWLQVMGRLKPGATADQVKGRLEGLFLSEARAGFSAYVPTTAEERNWLAGRSHKNVPRLHVDTANRGIYDVNADDIQALMILAVVVALVLLIVCANVANLLLSRAETRQKELSVRLSIGATRGRLVRQLLTESLILAGIGGAVGILIAYWGGRLLPQIERYGTDMDWSVVAFTAVLTTATGMVFGIASGLRATRMSLGTALKESSRSVTGSNSTLSRTLLIAQITMAVVLLIGAGLFLRTLNNLRHVDVGFNPNNLVLVFVDPELARYDEDRAALYFQQSVEQLGSVPGVRAVTLSDPALLSGNESGGGIFIPGRTYADGRPDDIHRVVVAPNFFETMQIPLVAGRGFTSRDDKSAPGVVIINEAAARKFFPGENPIGRAIRIRGPNSADIEIVGVLRDVKYNSLRESAPPTMYVPHLQRGPFGLSFAVRTSSDPAAMIAAVRDTLRRVDPNVPVLRIDTQMASVEERFEQEKLFAQAYALFSGLAVFIAAIGLFGLMSYSVVRRTREIGIRVAMGAQRREVLGLVLRESMLLVMAGLVIGVAAAAAAGHLIASQLYGVGPTDTTTLLTATVTMVVVAAAAGFLPARRATRVDPIVALRYE